MKNEMLEEIVRKRQLIEVNLKFIGSSVANSKRPYNELTNEEIVAAFFYIAATSETEDEIVHRAREEFNYPFALSLHPIINLTGFTDLTKRICCAKRGGVMMKDDSLVRLEIENSRGETIVI